MEPDFGFIYTYSYLAASIAKMAALTKNGGVNRVF